ncbi:hydroxypyruvate isomerase (plasmid) [Deinococcus psychrotolerans]|uniref:Hydroxypyruvate isomerase n=1 Tax=Deinococcus psychrotolerans TaxID=2489213 RepID=A0A3G8YKF4_9DEIO|nr:2-oxo-tetronate isomerase [Deinococcus psychrotolerans]AZI44767.1 hydroxypyruvate isomerase [Deinococcus psychrotolerans]
MPKYAANITMLFQEHDFLDRFDAAGKAGFQFIEYMFPYPYDAVELRAKLDQNNQTQALFNLPAGDWAGGDRGIAVQPSRQDEFREGVGKAIDYAAVLYKGVQGPKLVNVLVGKAESDEATTRKTIIGNLQYAADKLADAGLTLIVEPLNPYDVPGFYLYGTQNTLDLIEEVGRENVKLQYDFYHMQRVEGHLTQTVRENLDKIAHIQLADVPGRHQPGTGEINYPFLLAELDRLGYGGYVGLEYIPEGRTEDTLGWLKDLQK